MLPPRKPKPTKRATRWRSQAHCTFVRSHACVICWQHEGVEVAHVRLGSGTGMGQRPDDWRTVSLCRDHHREQHTMGEQTFWRGQDVEALIAEFIRNSPRRREIETVMAERGLRRAG